MDSSWVPRSMFWLAIASAVWLTARAHAHEGHGTGPAGASGRSPANTSDSVERRGTQRITLAAQPPHQGQVVKQAWQSFEVVYLPQETRVYFYTHLEDPLSAAGAGGQVTMEVRGNPQQFRYPLRFVSQPAGSPAQDYLVADVNVTQVRDGDMQVTVELTNLPYAQERQVNFRQTFALTRPNLPVRVMPLTSADSAEIARQRFCPVMDAGFDHGSPIKLLVGDRAIYVCCDACIEPIRRNPGMYLAKVPQQPAQESKPELRVEFASDADYAAVRAQDRCPVMNQPLGAHGRPLKIIMRGQTVFVCCQGCVQRVQENPAQYFAATQRRP